MALVLFVMFRLGAGILAASAILKPESNVPASSVVFKADNELSSNVVFELDGNTLVSGVVLKVNDVVLAADVTFDMTVKIPLSACLHENVCSYQRDWELKEKVMKGNNSRTNQTSSLS